MALTGNELVYLQAAQPNGAASSVAEPASVQSIAGLAVLKRGTFVANGATPVTVAYAAVAKATMIVFSLNTVGGTVGAVPTIQTLTAGTGFTVAASASDTSTYNWAAL